MHTRADELDVQRRLAIDLRHEAEGLLIELCRRLGEQEYLEWVDASLLDGESWHDVKEKALLKLEALNKEGNGTA